MSKFVVLELDGDWETGFRATLALTSGTTPFPRTWKGKLPPNPELLRLSQQYWHLFQNLGSPSRIKIQQVTLRGSINDRVQTCKKRASELRDATNAWLEAESFRPIADRLHAVLREDEEARFSVQSSNLELQKLPWLEWDLLKRCDRVEPALNSLETPPLASVSRSTPHPKVKILAILGHSEGINIEEDRRLLNELPNAEVTFLPEPKSWEITAQLWEQEWDIIFFAGHSQTEGDTGRLYINEAESLTVDELWAGLKTAVKKGLQLAIFNSCDGLGIARKLNDRSIPFIVVMREVVPDFVAQQYLRVFLKNYASGETFHAASRIAREQLHGIRLLSPDGEDFECPYATWLPVIYENPAAIAPLWEDLYRVEPVTAPIPTPISQPSGWRKIVLTSLFCTLLVMFVRSWGLLQPLELPAYDRLMTQRSPEPIDPRILAVEIAPSDINRYAYPLPDSTLAQLLQKLEGANPRIIGLATHRYEPRGTGRTELLDRIQKNPNLILVCSYNSDDKNHAPPRELTPKQIKSQMGFSDLIVDGTDRQGIVRRQLLSYHPDLAENISRCTTPFSFSFQLAYRYLQQSLLPVFTTREETGVWQVGDRVFKPLSQRFGGYQNLEDNTQIMLNYRSRKGSPVQSVTVEDVLSGKVGRDRIQGKLVLIGNTSYFAPHLDRTPYGEMLELWIQAHLTSQLLSTAIDNRAQIWVLPQWGALQWGDALWTFAWSLLGGILSWALKKRRIWLGLSLGAAFGLLYQTCLMILERGGWLPLVPSAAALLMAASFVALNVNLPFLSKPSK